MGEQSGTRAQRHSGWLQRGPAEASTATVAAMVPGLRPVPGAVSFSGKMSRWLKLCMLFDSRLLALEDEDRKY